MSTTTTTYQYDTHEEAEQEIIRLTALAHALQAAAAELNSQFKRAEDLELAVAAAEQKYILANVKRTNAEDAFAELQHRVSVCRAAEAVAAALAGSESEDDDSSSDYNPDEDEEEEVVPTITLKEVVKATGRNPEGAAAAKKRIKQIDEVMGLLRDRAPPVPTTAFGDGTCGRVDFTRPSMFGNENPELR